MSSDSEPVSHTCMVTRYFPLAGFSDRQLAFINRFLEKLDSTPFKMALECVTATVCSFSCRILLSLSLSSQIRTATAVVQTFQTVHWSALVLIVELF